MSGWIKKHDIKNDANYLDPRLLQLEKIRLTPMENTVTLATTTNRAQIGITQYRDGLDLMLVFINSTYVTKDVDYYVHSDKVSIVKQSGNWDPGTEIHFLVLKYVTKDPITFTDADQIANGSIPEIKLVSGTQQKLSGFDPDGQIPEAKLSLGVQDILDLVREIDTAFGNDPAAYVTTKNNEISSLDGRLDTLEPTVSGHTTTLNNKADKTELGTLSTLKTTVKTSAVAAINEVFDKQAAAAPPKSENGYVDVPMNGTGSGFAQINFTAGFTSAPLVFLTVVSEHGPIIASIQFINSTYATVRTFPVDGFNPSGTTFDTSIRIYWRAEEDAARILNDDESGNG